MCIGTVIIGCCSEKEIGLNSEYCMGKWEFVVKEQGGEQQIIQRLMDRSLI